MTPRDLARLQRVERELEEAKRALRLIPVRFARGASDDAPTLIRIRRGNKIAEYSSGPAIKVYGMKHTAGTSITAILAAERTGSDPVVASGMDEGYQDGLCWGTIVDTDVNVFVSNKATPVGGTAQTDVTVNYCLPENAFVYCRRSVSVQLTGDTNTLFPVYLVWRV